MCTCHPTFIQISVISNLMIRMNAIGSIFSLFLGLQLLSTPIRKNGDLSGILESKGEAWVEIKEDSGFRNRYLAPWHGGSPSKGGGFDPRILKIIQETVVGNRVYLKWKHDGHLRIEELAVIVPRESRGIFTGKLVEIGNHWVDFENPDDRIPWRFYLRWIGGYPENGGGYDGRSREELIARSDQGLLRFRWSYDVRPRFDSILNLEGYQEPLFYEVENLPPCFNHRKIQSLQRWKILSTHREHRKEIPLTPPQFQSIPLSLLLHLRLRLVIHLIYREHRKEIPLILPQFQSIPLSLHLHLRLRLVIHLIYREHRKEIPLILPQYRSIPLSLLLHLRLRLVIHLISRSTERKSL